MSQEDPNEKPRQLVRVELDGECSWAEHVDGNLYRSLNGCFTEIVVSYPADHPMAEHNGKMKLLAWGDLFEANVEPNRRVSPLRIVGEDRTPRKE